MYEREIMAKRAELIKEARAILDAAEAEKRSTTAEENERYDRINADIDAQGAQIRRLQQQAKLEEELRQSANTPPKTDPSTESKGDDKEARAAAFAKMLRSGYSSLTEAERRTQSLAPDTSGGFLVPDQFAGQLLQALNTANVLRGLATVIPTSGDYVLPVVAAHGSAAWMDENAEYGTSDETFAQIKLSAYKLGTMVKVSEELLKDSAFPLDSYLANEFARRFGAAEEAAFAVGDGSSKPTGLMVDATEGKVAASNSAITSDEVIDLYHSLRPAYRGRGTFIMKDSTAKVLRQLKNGTTGDYLWQPGLQAGEPDRLLGRPVTVCDGLDAIGIAKKVIAFGDISYYWIAERGGRFVQRLTERYADYGQVGFRAYERIDGKLVLPEAVKYLQMKTS